MGSKSACVAVACRPFTPDRSGASDRRTCGAGVELSEDLTDGIDVLHTRHVTTTTTDQHAMTQA